MRSRNHVGIVLGAAVTLLATSVPALAQGSAPAAKAFVGGFGGVTFGTAESGTALGARAGVEIVPGVHIIGEFGRMSDVLPSEINDELEMLSDFIGAPVTFDITAPATYGFVGARVSRHTGRVSPFFEAGVGAAKVTIDLDRVTVDGIDITSLVRDELAGEELETTELLLVVGGGLNAELTRAVSLDFGYRYSQIFTDDPNVTTSTLYGMVVVGWQ